MRFRTRLSILSLESRDNPSGPELLVDLYTAFPPSSDPVEIAPADPGTGGSGIGSIGDATDPTEDTGGGVPLVYPF